MKKLLIGILSLVIIVGLTSCSPQTHEKDVQSSDQTETIAETNETENMPEATAKLKVVTTLFATEDFARTVGADHVEVVNILPPGVEAHHFEPTPQDLKMINESDIFIFTNKDMEPWVEKLMDSGSLSASKIVDTSVGIDLLDHHHDHDAEEEHDDDADKDHDDDADEEHDHDADEEHDDDADEEHDDDADEDHDHDADEEHSEHDPHIWTSLKNAQTMVKNIAEAFIEVDAANKDYYQENLESYLEELADLDKEYEEAIQKFSSRVIITGGHFAFGYLAHDYDLEYHSPYEGYAPNAEPSPKNIEELKKLLESSNSTAIYYEEIVDPKVAELLSEETGSKMLLLHAAHNRTQEEKEEGLTYLQIMKNNLESLKEGLGSANNS